MGDRICTTRWQLAQFLTGKTNTLKIYLCKVFFLCVRDRVISSYFYCKHKALHLFHSANGYGPALHKNIRQLLYALYHDVFFKFRSLAWKTKEKKSRCKRFILAKWAVKTGLKSEFSRYVLCFISSRNIYAVVQYRYSNCIYFFNWLSNFNVFSSYYSWVKHTN